jgi:glycosyltransferase involved in cell wall biosynthesis
MFKHAIILPLKESFTIKNSGAVSIWVNDYIKSTKLKKDIAIIAAKNFNKQDKYLKNQNLFTIKTRSNLRTNYNYIRDAAKVLIQNNIKSVEIHNRPEYALYLNKTIPNIKINLIFHNDPNNIRGSSSQKEKISLINKCSNIIFVSNYLKEIFFKGINTNHQNNIHIIYNSVDKQKKFPKKKKIIVFSGKLNKSKGYPIFLSACKKILNKTKDWKIEVFGNEPRENYPFIHNRFKLTGWVPHNEMLKIYDYSSISVVNPTWDEPFGRTAMESASRGNAVITSESGGLKETFKNNLVLKDNSSTVLAKTVLKLINNKKLLNKIQKTNFLNPLRLREHSTKSLDALILNQTNYASFKSSKYKILHVSTFGEKTDHRTFNLSISNKITKGLIRNGNDVINFDYRDKPKIFFEDLDQKILRICQNYRPDLILFGHNNILQRPSLIELKKNSKIALWFEDHLVKGDPSYKKNLNLIEKNHDLIDNYFVTTAPDKIKTKINKNKIFFLPIPVDPNIEEFNFYLCNKDKDLFFALSHGVNYGKLKNNTDEREVFLNELINNSKDKINFHILGFNREEPKWNYNYYKELMRSRIALNFSRGGPTKYTTSNRIATLVGNGVATAVTDKIKWQDFFNKDEMIFYKNKKDLINKILFYKKNPKKLKNLAKKGKSKYFKIFNNKIISDYIIHKVFKSKPNFKYAWK